MANAQSTKMKAALIPYIVSNFPHSSTRFKSDPTTRSEHRLSSGYSSGFSLFEVLIVVTILSLAGVMAIPYLIGWRSNMRLISAVNELRANLETAKAFAARENTTVTLQFEPGSGRYRMTYRGADDTAVAIKAGQLPHEIRIDPTHPGYTLTGHKTSFNARGGADNGTIVLSNSKGQSRKISISIIGKIEVKN